MYNKFGFCKYRETCRRYHCEEICKEDQCKNKNICRKRHPKTCKKFLSQNGCRFGSGCSYKHSSSQSSKEENDLAVKVELLKSIVEQMAQKIVHLEKEVDDIKKTSNNQMDSIIELEDLSSNKSMTNKISIEETNDIEVTKDSNESKEVNTDQTTSTAEGGESDCEPLTDKDPEKQEILDSMFHCEKCVYQCKKEVTFKKHINTKHSKQKCKVCYLDFNTTIELLKHVAEEHKSSIVETINNSEKKKENIPEDQEVEVEGEIEDGKFKCARCKKIVTNEDTFNIHKEDSQKMCQFCTMVSQYE